MSEVVEAKYSRTFILAIAMFAASISALCFLQRYIDRMYPSRQRMGEKLIYVPAGNSIKVASLGFDALGQP